MDETLSYAVFGGCLVAIGICGLIVYGNFQWKHSQQRAHEEYWRFRWYMNHLDIERESVSELLGSVKSTDELHKINNELRKILSHEPV
jgi:hypothetical protein